MCVVSMVMDHYHDKWKRNYLPQPSWIEFQTEPLKPSREELDEFRRLLDRARKYDEENNQPDCELDSKRQALKKMADELGVEIEFV